MGGKLRIDVKQVDIDYAIPRNSHRCAVADAIARQVVDAIRVKVDAQFIRMTRDGVRWLYPTPSKVYDYLVAFDAGDKLQPFSFHLGLRYRIQRRKFTPAGRKANNIRAKARRDALREGQSVGDTVRAAVQAATESGELPTGPRTHADVYVAEADAKLRAADGVLESNADATGIVGRAPRNRGGNTKWREYGQRRTRVNRDKAGLASEPPHSLDT